MLGGDVVTLAQGLPGVVLKEHDHWTSITYRGKGFGWVNHEEDTAMELDPEMVEGQTLIDGNPRLRP